MDILSLVISFHTFQIKFDRGASIDLKSTEHSVKRVPGIVHLGSLRLSYEQKKFYHAEFLRDL